MKLETNKWDTINNILYSAGFKTVELAEIRLAMKLKHDEDVEWKKLEKTLFIIGFSEQKVAVAFYELYR